MTNAPLLEDMEGELRRNFLGYTRKAYALLPPMDAPNILDIGCGAGEVTVELARLSRGRVVGIDINPYMLERLRLLAMREGVDDRVTGKLCSMHDIRFPEESFDVIWTEGSIQFIGAEAGLKEWKRFLRPGGHMVLHVEKREKLSKALVKRCGYKFHDGFELPENAWWDHYYAPLEERLPGLYDTYEGDPEAIKALDAKKAESDMVKRDMKAFRTVFMVITKR